MSSQLIDKVISEENFTVLWNSAKFNGTTPVAISGVSYVGTDTNFITLEKSMFGNLLFTLGIEGWTTSGSQKRILFEKQKLKFYPNKTIKRLYQDIRLIDSDIAEAHVDRKVFKLNIEQLCNSIGFGAFRAFIYQLHQINMSKANSPLFNPWEADQYVSELDYQKFQNYSPLLVEKMRELDLIHMAKDRSISITGNGSDLIKNFM